MENFQRAERSAINLVGGIGIWMSVDPQQQQRYIDALLEQTLKQLAIDASTRMTETELCILTVFISGTGCQMHKDLNTAKKAYQKMKAEWEKFGMAPCLLSNRDDASALDATANGQGAPW